MSRMRKILNLELFRDAENSGIIDDLQDMVFLGMFDEDNDDD